MAQTLGKQLARKREGDGISLEDVAHRTRIPVNGVRCLENDDYSGFPNSVYARSFLRMYCAHLGVDGTAFLEEMRQAGAARPTRSARSEPRYFRSQVTQAEVDEIGQVHWNFGWFPWRAILSVLFFTAILGAGGYVGYGLWEEYRQRLATGDASSPTSDANASEENLIGGEGEREPTPEPLAVPAGESPVAPVANGGADKEEIVLRAVPIEPPPSPAPDAAATAGDPPAGRDEAAGDPPAAPAEGPGVSSNAPVDDPDAVAVIRTVPPSQGTRSGPPPRDSDSSVSRSAN